MASNKDFLVVEVEHNYFTDKVEHSVYCSSREKAFELAKEWKRDRGTVLVYECIAEAEVEQIQTSKIVLKD